MHAAAVGQINTQKGGREFGQISYIDILGALSTNIQKKKDVSQIRVWNQTKTLSAMPLAFDGDFFITRGNLKYTNVV